MNGQTSQTSEDNKPIPASITTAFQYTPLCSAVPSRPVLDVFRLPVVKELKEAISVSNLTELQAELASLGQNDGIVKLQNHLAMMMTSPTLNLMYVEKRLASLIRRQFKACAQNSKQLPPTTAELQPLAQMIITNIQNQLKQRETEFGKQTLPATPIASSNGHRASSIESPWSGINQSTDEIVPFQSTSSMKQGQSSTTTISSPFKSGSSDISHSPWQNMTSLRDLPNGTSEKIQRTTSEGLDRNGMVMDDANRLLINDKTRANHILEQLQAFINAIFEAEDNREHDTSNRTEDTSTIYWALESVTSSEPELSMEMIHRFYNLLRRARLSEVVEQISFSDLSRMQKMMERSLKLVNVERLLTLEAGLLGDEDEQCWVGIVAETQRTIACGQCLLTLLTNLHLDKRLYSEVIFLTMVDCCKSILDDMYFRWSADGRLRIDYKTTNRKAATPSVTLLKTFHKLLDVILQTVVQFLQTLNGIIEKLNMTENVISRTEFLAIAVIFAELPTKDTSICSVLTLDSLKVAAMNLLQTIYIKYSDQRRFLLDELLSSLNKLPATRQSSRQFKLSDGKSIQLVSALLLSLVQSSTIEHSTSLQQHVALVTQEDQPKNPLPIHAESFGNAVDTANYIVSFLVSKISKIGRSANVPDATYRALLDIFTEDFVTVLPLPMWPASELLLRTIAKHMMSVVDDSKQSVLMKGHALEVLGAISTRIRKTSLEIQNLQKGDQIRSHFDSVLVGLPLHRIDASTTPSQFRALIEVQSLVHQQLTKHHASASICLGASQYLKAHWRQLLSNLDQDERFANHEIKSITLEQLENLDKGTVTTSLAHLEDVNFEDILKGYSILSSFSGLQQLFDPILMRLLSVLENSQVTLRTKALRWFGHLATVDPTILSMKSVHHHIASRVADHSPQVRDVSIDLVGKFITANPDLGKQYYPVLSERASDTGLSVRKRVIKILKDVYMRHSDITLKVSIAERFLQRLDDEEDSVQELVLRSFEEMWFLPFNEQLDTGQTSTYDMLSMTAKRAIDERVDILRCLVSGSKEDNTELVTSLLVQLSERLGKTRNDFMAMIKAIVQCLIARFLETEEEVLKLDTLIVMHTIGVAVPTAFTSEQLAALSPHLHDASGKFEQTAIYYISSLYMAVLKHLTSKNHQFLGELRDVLLTQLTKLPTKVLTKVVPCLCEVVGLLNDYKRVTTTLKSCINAIVSYKSKLSSGGRISQDKRIVLFLCLGGLFGRYSYFEDEGTILQEMFQINTRTALMDYIVSIVLPFCVASVDQVDPIVHRAALQCLGNICVGSPSLFLRKECLDLFDQVLNGESADAKKVIFRVFLDFLEVEERKTEDALKQKKKKKKGKAEDEHIDVGILTGNTDKFAGDGISPSLIQRYLQQILSAALGDELVLAQIATEVVRSTVDQGLANPRSCVPSIVALETSSVKKIRDVALQMHLRLNEKHESLIETCYVEGVRSAFEYQSRIGRWVKDRSIHAHIAPLYSVIRISRQARKKFLVSLVRTLDIDVSHLERVKAEAVDYTSFLCQNLASLDFVTTEEVHVVIHGLDRILSTSCVSFMQLLESDEVQTADDQRPIYAVTAAILALAISLKRKLKAIYGFNEAKCQAFDITKTGSKTTETKLAGKQEGIEARLDVSEILSSLRDGSSISLLRSMYSEEEHPSITEYNLDVEENPDSTSTNEAAYAETAPVGTLLPPQTPRKKRKISTPAGTPQSARKRKAT